LIKNISPRRPTRGTTNLALQFPSCPLDATSTLRDGAHSIADLLFLSEVPHSLLAPSRWGPLYTPLFATWGNGPCSLLDVREQQCWQQSRGPAGQRPAARPQAI
jgi:hypothetical protein